MNEIVIVVATLAETAKRQHQFAAINPFLHQLLTADGDPCVAHRCRDTEVRTVEGQGALGQCREQVVLFGPQGPLGVIGGMVPGQGVVQGGAVAQVLRVLIQTVTLRIFRAAHRRHLFAHQSMAGQAGEFAVGVVQGQINFACAKVDIVIAHPQVQ